MCPESSLQLFSMTHLQIEKFMFSIDINSPICMSAKGIIPFSVHRILLQMHSEDIAAIDTELSPCVELFNGFFN